MITISLEGGDEIRIDSFHIDYNAGRATLNIRRPKLVTASGNEGYAQDLNIPVENAVLLTEVQAIAESQNSLNIMMPTNVKPEV